MMVAVADTSALIRLFVPDGPLPRGFEAAIDAAAKADAVLLAPELALVEAGQVLRKKEAAGFLDAPETDEIVALLMSLPIEWVGHAPLLPLSIELARDEGITVYDAVFLALTVERGAVLFTADDQLATAAERHEVI